MNKNRSDAALPESSYTTNYEDRMLFFADILGWSQAIKDRDPQRLVAAVSAIHSEVRYYDSSSRTQLVAMHGRDGVSVNPMRLAVRYGAFSDHFVISMPKWFGGRILSAGNSIIIALLRLGFLTRGAIVCGPLFHDDNLIFGEALLDAVKLEACQVVHPRILVTDSAYRACKESWPDASDDQLGVINDQHGCRVVNFFHYPRVGKDACPLIDENLHVSNISEVIRSSICRLEREGTERHAAKWRYIRDFIEGPVIAADERLKPFWK